MTDTELAKVIMHRLAHLEHHTANKAELEEIHDRIIEQNERLEEILLAIRSLQAASELHHRENINSDDVLLRSILSYREPVPFSESIR